MSRRREVQGKLRQLGEIGEIMGAMKNLAFMESRKLGRYAEAQQQGIELIEKVAADFFQHHPQPVSAGSPCAMLVIGSERGFCGEFNEQLLKEIVSTTREDPGGENAAPQLIAVGNKLCDRLRDRGFESIALEGATVAEDLPDVLVRVVEALADLQQKHPVLCLQALIHGVGPAPLQTKQLLPPFQGLPPAEAHAYPPLMYLSPAEFYGELLKHYLGAVLGHLLHASLLAENDQRVRHLEGAIQRLEEKTSDLERRSRALRQEEITEEIEIILLSVECGIRGPRGGVLQVNPPNSTV